MTVTAAEVQEPVGVIACGAIARELIALTRFNNWTHLELHCLPAELHNSPEKIPGCVEEKLLALRDRYRQLFVAYADCGTGGRLDALLGDHGVDRLPGAHCYDLFAGSAAFDQLMAEEPGTFFLTDFLVRHFERLVIRGLALDCYPELIAQFFGHYRRVLYLAQESNDSLKAQAETCAQQLGLDFEYRFTGYGKLQAALADQEVLQWKN